MSSTNALEYGHYIVESTQIATEVKVEHINRLDKRRHECEKVVLVGGARKAVQRQDLVENPLHADAALQSVESQTVIDAGEQDGVRDAIDTRLRCDMIGELHFLLRNPGVVL